MGKGEKAGYQLHHFLLFQQCFQVFLFRIVYNQHHSAKVYPLSHIPAFKPFPKQQNLSSPKLEEFADYNFNFDENGNEFSKNVQENTWGKGEIARCEQFLLFTHCFQKTCAADTKKTKGLFENGLVMLKMKAF